MLNVQNRQTSYKPSFGTLLRITEEGRIIDTYFARGLNTMKFVANHLNELNRPTTSFHFAGSIGQEAISDKMLLKNPLSEVISLDIDKEAIALGRSGIHSLIYNAPDAFIFQTDSSLTATQRQFKNKFNELFVRAQRPNFVLNNKFNMAVNNPLRGYIEHFFRLKDEYAGFIEYKDAQFGDVFEISKNFKNQADALYTRNFIYQPTGNNIKRVIQDGESVNETNIEVLDKFAQEAYSGIKDNGLLILGSCISEHFYNAAANISEKIKFKKTSIFRMLDYGEQLNSEDLEIFAKSPLEAALEKDNKFKPIFFDGVEFYPNIKVPTVWQKQ